MKNFIAILTCLISFVVYSQEPTTNIYLIRHAEKADATTDPDLSDAGKLRTKKWADYFKDKHIEMYCNTPYKRTMQTVIGISSLMIDATETKTITLKYEVYAPENLLINDVAKNNLGKSVLIVGHSDTIPAAVNKLIGSNVYKNIPENEFNNLYIITIRGSKITHSLVKI